jgi:hypothetical protein
MLHSYLTENVAFLAKEVELPTKQRILNYFPGDTTWLEKKTMMHFRQRCCIIFFREDVASHSQHNMVNYFTYSRIPRCLTDDVAIFDRYIVLSMYFAEYVALVGCGP